MPQWENSTRRDRLPPDWDKRRKRVGKRDGWMCQVRIDDVGNRCLEPANEVDHIIANDDHGDHNLRCICTWHHRKKSSSEGGNARAAAKRQRAGRLRRQPEAHPGAL